MMNILMMTNTFTPHVGGVARSVQSFTDGYRKRGHRTLVVAPEYENMPTDEVDVIRIPAIKKEKGSLSNADNSGINCQQYCVRRYLFAESL